MSAEKPQPPRPPEVDELAREMVELKGKISSIQEKALADTLPLVKRAGELREQALAWLKEFGSAHAEKSKLLHGALYEILGTFSSTSSIDNAAVECFRLALVKAKQARLVNRIFEKTVRWSLRSDFAATIKTAKLPAKLLALYSQCQVTKEKAPVITPRLRDEKAA